MTRSGSIADLIDHTLLRPDSTAGDIERLCREALRYGFCSVCVHPSFVPLARQVLAGSRVKVSTVIGFPTGATMTRVKVFEAIESSLCGCDEMDIVMHVGLAKAGQWGCVQRDIADVIAATSSSVHKVIIETCYLSWDEKVRAAEMVCEMGAEFVKTSTGFGHGGATAEDIALLASVVKDRCGIKASGGIRTFRQVRDMTAAGASRIGTSSGPAIMEEYHALEG